MALSFELLLSVTHYLSTIRLTITKLHITTEFRLKYQYVCKHCIASRIQTSMERINPNLFYIGYTLVRHETKNRKKVSQFFSFMPTFFQMHVALLYYFGGTKFSQNFLRIDHQITPLLQNCKYWDQRLFLAVYRQLNCISQLCFFSQITKNSEKKSIDICHISLRNQSKNQQRV